MKPRHVFEGLFATPRDFLGGWKHLLRRWARMLNLSRPTDFVKHFQKRGINASVKLTEGGHLVVCHFCGNAIVTFEMKRGFYAEMCSAAGSEKLFSGKQFETWLALLETADVTSSTEEKRQEEKTPQSASLDGQMTNIAGTAGGSCMARLSKDE